MLVFILLIFGLIKCSYTPGKALPENYRTIYIASFINDTQETDLSFLLQNEVKQNLSEDGTLAVITDIKKADLLVAVRIGKFAKSIITYTEDSHLPDEIRIGIEIKLVVQDVHTKDIIRSQIIEDSLNYTLITEPMKTDINAKEELLKQLSQKIVSSVVQGFY